MQNFVGKTKCIAGYMKVANLNFQNFRNAFLGIVVEFYCIVIVAVNTFFKK